jgi:hypothetical protein
MKRSFALPRGERHARHLELRKEKQRATLIVRARSVDPATPQTVALREGVFRSEKASSKALRDLDHQHLKLCERTLSFAVLPAGRG